MTPRAGSTLVELIVTLAVMAIVAAAVALALPAKSPAPNVDVIAAARREAIVSRRRVSVRVIVMGHAAALTANPDGSVVADSGIAIDRLSGEATRVTR